MYLQAPSETSAFLCITQICIIVIKQMTTTMIIICAEYKAKQCDWRPSDYVHQMAVIHLQECTELLQGSKYPLLDRHTFCLKMCKKQTQFVLSVSGRNWATPVTVHPSLVHPYTRDRYTWLTSLQTTIKIERNWKRLYANEDRKCNYT